MQPGSKLDIYLSNRFSGQRPDSTRMQKKRKNKKKKRRKIKDLNAHALIYV